MQITTLGVDLAELGIVAARSPHKLCFLLSELKNGDCELPGVAKSALLCLVRQVKGLESEIARLDCEIQAWHRESAVSQKLATIPGIGPLTATALAFTIADPSQFRSARQFAAWLGLVPRQNSSGGKDRLGRITKMGDSYLRKLLVVGTTAVLRHAVCTQTRTGEWVRHLLERKSSR